MRMSEADFDKVIDVNLKSVLIWPSDSKNVLKACRINNMSSVVGVKGMQDKLTMPLQKQVL
jgi:NAD(P)-dependent dehydrogenase (short-subunit alcohol dehydrogenase family)